MRFALVHNIGCANGVLSIGISPTLKIAAATWTEARRGPIAATRIACLKFAIQRLLKHHPDWELWLVAGHRAVQPDSRVTRHFGLWKSLEKRGTDVPAGDFIEETLVPCEGGIRFFGAVRFVPDQLDKVCGVLNGESAAIVALNSLYGGAFLKKLVAQGWSKNNTSPPEEILESVSSTEGFVFHLFGEFDDAEVTVAVMGKEELVARLKD